MRWALYKYTLSPSVRISIISGMMLHGEKGQGGEEKGRGSGIGKGGEGKREGLEGKRVRKRVGKGRKKEFKFRFPLVQNTTYENPGRSIFLEKWMKLHPSSSSFLFLLNSMRLIRHFMPNEL